MTAKKERIKVDPYNFKPTYALPNGMNFSLASSPNDGRKQVRDFSICKDWINDTMTAFFNYKEDSNFTHYDPKKHAPVDMEALRLLIATNGDYDKFRKNIYAGKRIINMYEKLAGFKKTSKVTRVIYGDGEYKGQVKNCWLLTGPGEWMRASNLVSMVTLILRFVNYHEGFEDLENLDQVEKRFEEICKSEDKYQLDIHYMTTAWPKFRFLMERYDTLFRNKEASFWFPEEFSRNWHGRGGIVSLCSYQVDNISYPQEKVTKGQINTFIKEEFESWEKEFKARKKGSKPSLAKKVGGALRK